MCWCTPGKPIADCPYCLEESRGKVMNDVKASTETVGAIEQIRKGRTPLQLPVSLEIDPALKLRIDTAMAIIERYEPLVRENKIPGVLVIGDVSVGNPVLEAYYNAVGIIRDYLDPKQPLAYFITNQKE